MRWLTVALLALAVEAAKEAVEGWRHQNESYEWAVKGADANNHLADTVDAYRSGEQP